MMRTSVEGFEHRTGSHCASTALRDVLEFKGISLSEAMVLGLGAGPWFVLFEDARFSPQRFFHGRTVSFEHDVAAALGVTFDEAMRPFDDAMAEARRRLAANDPVLMVSDVRWLPYFDTTSHFNGHRIVMNALDDDGNAWVTDSHFPGVQRVDAGNFRRSVTSSAPPYPKTEVVSGTLRVDRAPVVKAAIRPALRACADVNLDASETTGLGGIERLAATLPEWEGLSDPRWACRFAYQVIERRGTGGALFRRLYARFLAECADRFADVVARSLVPLAEVAADRWTALATEFKSQSEKDAPSLRTASRLAATVLEAERTLWESARERAG